MEKGNASELNDLDRTNATQIMMGTVVKVDTKTGKTTVNINQKTISGIRVMAHRAGANGKSLWLPAKDEQVVIVSPIGNITQGIIIGSIYYGEKDNENKTDLPSDFNPLIKKIYYPDGATTSYDATKHELLISLKNGEEEENEKIKLRFYTDNDKKESGLEFKLGEEITFAATQKENETEFSALNLQKGNAHIQIQNNENISIKTDKDITFSAENITLSASNVKVEKK